MAEKKQTGAAKGAGKPEPPPPPPAEQTSSESKRKPWVKKTPVEVVLEQIAKQEEKVNDMRAALKKEERELEKLQQAKKVLEAS